MSDITKGIILISCIFTIFYFTSLWLWWLSFNDNVFDNTFPVNCEIAPYGEQKDCYLKLECEEYGGHYWDKQCLLFNKK